MFSALKFVAASVIVALFGSFLMMGLLSTQPAEEAVTTAVSASPTTDATSEATSEPTEAETTSVRADLLPGVTLTVEEVEPGVFHVLDDGVRARFEGDIVAGHDGSILLVRGGDERQRGSFIRLGSRGSRRLPQGHTSQVVATPDGTVWVLTWGQKNRSSIHSLKDGTWTRRSWAAGGPAGLTVGPDGTIWFADVKTDEKDVGRLVIKRMGADGWQRVGKATLGGDLRADAGNLIVAEGGVPWWAPYDLGHSFDFGDDGSWRVVGGGSLSRLDTWKRRGGGSESHEVTIYAPVYIPGMLGVELGSDGAVWLAGVSPLMVDAEPVRSGDSPFAAPAEPFVMRYDGTGWQRWGPDEGVPSLTWSRPQLAQGPDGGLWVSARPDIWFMPPDATDPPFDGIARFDGSTWRYFLSGHDVSDWDIAPDGSVWLRMEDPDNYFGSGLYVITPEAVAASE